MKTHRIAALLSIATMLVACGKGEVQMIDGEGEEGRYGSGGQHDNMPLYLESVVPLPMQSEATNTVSIEVRLMDRLNQTGERSQAVQFELTQSADMQTSLSSLSAITDDQGVATVDLRLGMLAGPAKVTVKHPQAGPLVVDVNVGEATTGKIRVDITDPANSPIDLAPYRISFFETSAIACATYRPRERQPEPITAVHVPDNQPFEQQGFPPGKMFTVIAEAVGEGGLTLAGGCADDVSVVAGNTKVVPVQLDLAPIAPSGTYAVESSWDISEAIASQNGATSGVVRVIEFMANPGEAIYNTVIDAIDDAVGFNIDLLLDIAGINDRAIDYINGQLFQYGSIETFSAISADLSTMLNELQVKSRLNIAKTDQDYNFTGSEQWTSVTVSWTWQCEQQNNESCSTQEVDLTENGASAGVVSYDWTGFVQDYDTLIIESHQAQIDIGRLQLYLLEQVILPEMTNGAANSLGEALAYWIDCNALARAALQGAEVCDPTGFLCVGEDEAAAACEFGITELGDYLAGPLENQSTMLEIDLAGEATLVDADASGIADGIIDGRTEGTLNGSSEPVVVQWSAAVQN